MVVTAETLCGAKAELHQRFAELSAAVQGGRLRQELQRHVRYYRTHALPEGDGECLRQLLCAMLEQALPDYLHD